jgi:hypothetical protein
MKVISGINHGTNSVPYSRTMRHSVLPFNFIMRIRITNFNTFYC